MPATTRLHSAAASRTLRGTANRLSWGLADQAVSSLTNFAVGIYVARSLGTTAFGVFTLAWVTYAVVITLSRGLATDPLVVRFSGVPNASWRSAVAQSSGTALVVGVITGAVSLLAGIAIGGAVGAGFVALGLVLPALLLQDSWRYAFFAAGQGRKAFINDVLWAVALIPGLLLAAQHASVFGVLLAWGASGAVAAAFGCVQIGLLPRPERARAWIHLQRDLGPRYLVENASSSSSGQIRMYGLGAIAGLADIGAVRGAELLLGPFQAVLIGLSLVAVPEAARVLQQSPRRLPLFCLLLGGGQAIAALAWGTALLLLLTDRIGEYILGPVWQSAAALILPTTLSVMNASFSTGAAAGLRALGAAPRSLRAQLFTSGSFVSGGLLGAVISGAQGSTWGCALATLLGAGMSWWQFRIAIRESSIVHQPTMRLGASARAPIGAVGSATAADKAHEETRTR